MSLLWVPVSSAYFCLEMDSVASSVVEKIKGFGASSTGFVKRVFRKQGAKRGDSQLANPIEILKRLQREVFSDLMKLRDRQDKLERILSFYKSVKGSPFIEASTHMTGIVDVAGALLFVESNDEPSFDALNRAGLRTGIYSRFSFETPVRQKDTLTAEFVTSQNSLAYHGVASGSPLALAKVMYMANLNDWLSVASIPLGARCNDFGIGSKQGERLNRFSSSMPPTFSQYYCCGAGLIVRQPNVEFSLAELVSGLGMPPDAAGKRSWLSTFWQINYRPIEEARIALSCLLEIPTSSLQLPKLGTLAIPVGGFRRSIVQAESSPTSAGSFALMLDTEFDETTNVGGWVEVQKLRPSLFQWGFSLSDSPEDELGWGLRLGGKVDGQLNQFQFETFLNFNLGKRVNLQPALVYVADGRTRTPALVFRSSWSM